MKNKTCNDCKLSRPSGKDNWVKCTKKHNDLKLATAPQCETPYITNGDIIRNMSDRALAMLIVYYVPNVGYSSALIETMERTENLAVEKTIEALKKEANNGGKNEK